MHSSRMCTGRSLTVCQSLLPGGVCFLGGESVSGGVSDPGGCVLLGRSASGGICLVGVVSHHTLRQTPPPHVDRITDAWGVLVLLKI